MEKTKCCLCSVSVSGFLRTASSKIKESYLKKIPSYYTLFPSAPYRPFQIDDKYICVACAEKFVNLFGCKVHNNFTSSASVELILDSWQNKEELTIITDKAIRFVEKMKSSKWRDKSDENFNSFIDYALSMPLKINQFKSSKHIIVTSLNERVYNAVDDLEKHLANIISQLNVENKIAQSKSHTFAIVENALVFLDFNENFLDKRIAELRYRAHQILTKMHAEHTLESDELDSFLIELSGIKQIKPNYTTIPLNRINHFKLTGNISYTSDVHGGGGGGGGANIGGAVIGGLLFGGAGAIVGSQVGTDIQIDEIKTEITQHDDRNVEFFYEDESGKTVSVIFDSSAYDCLMKLIPEKAFDSVMVNANLKKESITKESEYSSLSQLKELKELLDMGIITQEEFDTKKKQLLGL